MFNDLYVIKMCLAKLYFKKEHEQKNFLCFSAALETSHEDLRRFSFCGRHKFATKHCCALLSTLIYLIMTCRMYSRVYTATMINHTRHTIMLQEHGLSSFFLNSCLYCCLHPVFFPLQFPICTVIVLCTFRYDGFFSYTS